jgi:hypothetical protein
MIGTNPTISSRINPPETKLDTRLSTPKISPMIAPTMLRPHAHPFPAHSPYAKTNERIPRPIAIIPSNSSARARKPSPARAAITT